MKLTTRTTRECIELLVATLQKQGPCTRAELYQHTQLDGGEMKRGIGCLLGVHVIRNQAEDDQKPCYALTGQPLLARHGAARAKSELRKAPKLSFDSLLSVWEIRCPSRPTPLASRRIIEPVFN
ncbi:hypothetical protein D3C81_1787220 [compost metagenome]